MGTCSPAVVHRTAENVDFGVGVTHFSGLFRGRVQRKLHGSHWLSILSRETREWWPARGTVFVREWRVEGMDVQDGKAEGGWDQDKSGEDSQAC